MRNGRFVAYYRVSTARQGRSGLGLDAQREAVAQHLNGGKWHLAGEFTEIESGRSNSRPQLLAALMACRVHRATLIIAKLDRLARNVAFVSNLMEAGVDFEACDFPQANRLTIHILAAVAEHEARMISDRTKAALAAAKARGTKLGGFRGRIATSADRERGRATRTNNALAFARDLAPLIEELQLDTPTAIAASLNEREITAPRGGLWSATQAQRLLLRIRAGSKTDQERATPPLL